MQGTPRHFQKYVGGWTMFLPPLFLAKTLEGVLAFNATFNIISVILWRSVLFVGETRGHGEKHPSAASH